jgi:hypothetical protein
MVKQREEEGRSQLERSLRREAQLRLDLEDAEERRKNQAKRFINILCEDGQ